MKDFWRRIWVGENKGLRASLQPAQRYGAFPISHESFLDLAHEEPSARPLLRVGYASDQGRDRDHNEDSFFCWHSVFRQAHDYISFGLFIVADGVGGHLDGESASELATHIVACRVLRETFAPILDRATDKQNNQTLGRQPDPINEVLVSALEVANQAIHDRLRGAGTTVTAVLLMEDTAFFAHVGDSRGYLLQGGTLQHITHDHSLVGRLLEAGAISEEEALTHPQRNIIYRSLGQGDALQVDWYSVQLHDSSEALSKTRILLCTDGLWGSVPDRDMARIIEASSHPQQACDRLTQVARKRGSVDDVTVILIEQENHSAAKAS